MLAVYERVAGRGGPRSRRLGGRAAVVTVVAFDIGTVGWVLLLHVNDLMPPVTDGAFGFLRQVGVIAGLATGYPAVKWLSLIHI